MIPKILHMIWIGDTNAPDYLYYNFLKWKQLMPDWQIRLWNNGDLNTNEINGEYLNLINSTNIGAQKADLLRYYIVNRYGGYYVDADVTPERNLNELNCSDYDLVVCHDLEITWEYIAIGFFAATPNNPTLEYVINKMHKVDLNNKDIHLTTGPAAFGAAYFATRLQQKYLELPYWFFYRNKKGDIAIDGTVVCNDLPSFGSHQYAATWVLPEL